MIRLLVAVLTLSLLSATSARAGDRTSLLLQQLDTCAPGRPETYAPKLGLLLALADGRSAAELATLIQGPRPCSGYVSTYGTGSDELVFVGGIGAFDTNGALLWVDHGWWRIAAVPIGYMSGTNDVRRRGDVRELFAGIGSGGSAGTIGLVGIRIVGATATVMMRLLPGGELREVRLLDDDHLYVAGRLTNDGLFTWMSHPGWPYGAQWLFERRGETFVEVDRRQSRDPEWLMTGFVGALLARDVATMKRFATDGAVAEALDLPAIDRRIDGLRLLADRGFTSNEQMTWSALPDGVRTTPVSGPVYGFFTNYDYWVRTVLQVGMRFDRDGDGWIITGVRRISPEAEQPWLAP